MPDTRLVIAGTGPAEEELKNLLPDAHFTGWVDKQTLASLYQGLDLLIFPSRFDTFGNVIIEAMSYGMPVIAYNCKGPADIIQHDKNGFLVENSSDMGEQVICYLNSKQNHSVLSNNAIARSEDYRAEPIMQQFLQDLGLQQMPPEDYPVQRSVA